MGPFTLNAPGMLPWIPRFVIASRSVLVAPYTGSETYDQHIAKTIGSGGTYGFDEAIRFDPRSRCLVSIWVHIPEFPKPPTSELQQLMLKKPASCIPRLNTNSFRLEEGVRISVYFDSGGQTSFEENIELNEHARPRDGTTPMHLSISDREVEQFEDCFVVREWYPVHPPRIDGCST